ncbi:hypothetical protein F5B21DRAFT_529010 [Xylaria acuta]|nr:hypothetical protein F5B21DRAFT_529010 [Xylaria acuta]
MLRWLGNGFSVTYMESAEDQGSYQGDPAWYLELCFQSLPVQGRPEEDPEFRTPNDRPTEDIEDEMLEVAGAASLQSSVALSTQGNNAEEDAKFARAIQASMVENTQSTSRVQHGLTNAKGKVPRAAS